jgi:tyrosyl-tRNA synthetase
VRIQKSINDGANPMLYKKQLAHILTTELHSKEDADGAQAAFEHTFQDRSLNIVDIPTSPLSSIPEGASLIDILVSTGLAKSRSEARRLILQHAVDINGKVIESDDVISYEAGDIIKIGKKTFLKLV